RRPWARRRGRRRLADAQPRRGWAHDQGDADQEHLRGRSQAATLTYQEALEFISKQGRFAMKLGTERTRALLDRIGAPDRGLRGALIAGTNGKGSTGACLDSILRAAGRRVGFMPKPHLVSYTERIEVDGRPISESEFVAALEAARPAFDAVAAEMGAPTEFEMLTVLAVAYLAPRID